MNKRRIDADVLQLMESEHEVTLLNGLTDLCVKLPGPKETPYEGAVWRVRVTLPEAYPFKSPSVSFMDPILHPNVDEGTGAVCLDVLNQTWSPLFNLVNVFDSFLPQLLTYPNPDHPLNRSAANTAIKEPEKFAQLVRELSLHLAETSKSPSRKRAQSVTTKNRRSCKKRANSKKSKRTLVESPSSKLNSVSGSSSESLLSE
uniref:Ubiquitin-conjugating enzyme E2 H n=1 Tax=Rhodnius prolixus TaxID=13249 RepID=T1HCV5_RHOPR